jgi:predicted ABC-type ATPase
VSRRPPKLDKLLEQTRGPRPVAFVLAGHNGSGKSTLWYSRLASSLQMPLINADRMMMSILPDADPRTGHIPAWAQRLRDDDEKWQVLSQEGVRAFKSLVMDQRMPFAFETVFSHWKPLPGGGHASKADDIRAMQAAGYFVVLLFVGLVSVDMSVFRVSTRKQQGGHGVEHKKLIERFPRTQAAVGHATQIANMTLMFDNSRSEKNAFALVRAAGEKVGSFRRARPPVRCGPGIAGRVRPLAREGRRPLQTATRLAAQEGHAAATTTTGPEHPMSTSNPSPDQSSDWQLPWEGGCRCGQVRLRITAPPLLSMACHCTGCQTMSASAFSLSLAIPTQGFEVVAGEPVIGGAARRLAPFLLPALQELDVHAHRRHGLLRQPPAVDARPARMGRALRRNLDRREAALGRDAREAQLRRLARDGRLSCVDRGLCPGRRAAREGLMRMAS